MRTHLYDYRPSRRPHRLALLGCLLAAASTGVAQALPKTLGDALRISDETRRTLKSGSGTFVEESTIPDSSLGTLGTTYKGTVRFDAHSYTAERRTVDTRGYVPTYTLPDGTKGTGPLPGESTEYLRYLDDPGVRHAFGVGMRNAAILGVDLYGSAPSYHTVRNDLLLSGRCIPGVELTERVLRTPLSTVSGSRDLFAEFDVQGGHAKVVVSVDDDCLFRTARFEKGDVDEEIRLENLRRVAGITLPVRTRYLYWEKGRTGLDSVCAYDGVHLNDGSKPFMSRIPKDQLIMGFDASVSNQMFAADANGRPVFVRKKGLQSDDSSLKGLLYTGSLAFLVFAASATLARSLRRRRSSPKRA